MNTVTPTNNAKSVSLLRARTIAPLSVAALTLASIGAFGSTANAQSTATPSTTTSSTTTSSSTPSLTRVIQSSNPTAQKSFRSTEAAVASTTGSTQTALDVLNTDSDLSEFAAVVKAAGAESLFNRPEASWTYVLPSNSAFTVLDPSQVARLKDPKFKDQALSVVRQHVASGNVVSSDFTRRLPTGLPAPAPTRVQICNVVGGSLVNGVQIGGTTTCSTITLTPVVPPAAVDRVTMVSGRTIPVSVAVLRDPNGGANRFRVSLGGAAIETADYAVRNGVIHTTDTLILPGSSLNDLVGR